MLVASNYGQPGNPSWYHNLIAHPRCSVTVHGCQREMVAYEAEGDERDRLWKLDLSVYPARSRYAQRTRGRQIPVMVLQPVSAADPAGVTPGDERA